MPLKRQCNEIISYTTAPKVAIQQTLPKSQDTKATILKAGANYQGS
ncbi:24628_t:CDS:2 [Gigaspora rosea]|nr:24628_t:CDS:2 [Gigaspora rosea]